VRVDIHVMVEPCSVRVDAGRDGHELWSVTVIVDACSVKVDPGRVRVDAGTDGHELWPVTVIVGPCSV
jgi:hypothetical protein